MNSDLTTKYNQFLYNIIQLISHKKYNRAIKICQHLQLQGIYTSQLLTLHSYCLSKSKNHVEALEILKYTHSPLISMAKIQYQQELQLFNQSNQEFKEICSGNNSFVDNYHRSVVQTLTNQAQNVDITDRDHYTMTVDQREVKNVETINVVTEQFQFITEKYERKELDEDEYHQECKEIIERYRYILKSLSKQQNLYTSVKEYIKYILNIKKTKE